MDFNPTLDNPIKTDKLSKPRKLLHLHPSVIAVVMAIVALFLAEREERTVLRNVDWATPIFFASLFILVGELNEVGLLSILASGIQSLAGGNALLTPILLLWTVALPAPSWTTSPW